MTVSEIKTFLAGSNTGLFSSGIQVEQIGSEVQLRDLSGNILDDNTTLSLGINDYIPAVYDSYFPTNPTIQSYTTAEAIIHYLENTNNQVSYDDCYRYFRYQ